MFNVFLNCKFIFYLLNFVFNIFLTLLIDFVNLKTIFTEKKKNEKKV